MVGKIQVEWMDLPPRSGSGTTTNPEWDAVGALLRSQPGTWARVATNSNAPAASAIAQGGVAAFRPKGTFQAATRTVTAEDGTKSVDVYARFVGESTD